MFYALIAALFGALYGQAASACNAELTWIVASIASIGTFTALALPPLLFKYTNQDHAAVVLTRLMQRAAVGSALVLSLSVITYLAVGRPTDAVFLGEIYLFTLLSLFLFQGFGGVVTSHVLYLQQTHQYNSNQLVAVLLAVTLLLFTLVLYFLAFDLARPPEFHSYARDLLAITLTLIGYGRAVYLMAHH